MLRQVSGVGRDLVGDDAVFHVFVVGQAQVLFGGDVAEHRGSVPADHGCTDGRGDVIVSGRDVGNQRAKRIERRCIAVFDFFIHLLFDLIHGNVPRPFDHDLDIVFPGFLRQLAQSLKLGKLGFVAGVGDAARPQAVAEGIRDIMLGQDFCDLVKVLVQKILLVMVRHPLRQNGAASTHDAGDAFHYHRQILDKHARMDGHVVHALLRLLFNHFQYHVDVQVFHALHPRDGLIDRHGADGHRRVPQNGLANIVNIAAGGEVHHRICAKVHRGVQLLEFFINIRGHGRVADIGVDLAA